MSFLVKAENLLKLELPELHNGSRAEELLAVIDNIFHIKDLESLLESVLFEARRFTNADAGTIYLVANGRLYFSFVQNDTLFGGVNGAGTPGQLPSNRYISGDQSLPIDKSSLAGYVATSGESLLVDNVYDIRSGVTYTFNPDIDRKSSYTTRSILVVPLKTREDEVLGVLQLINKKSPGEIVPFSMQDRFYINQFAQSATLAIEKAKLTREMVLRLIEIIELRDPYETGEHAKRVSAYAVELYEAWARSHGVPDREIIQNRDPLRTGAILHDIGKVAVSDLIVKKPSELNDVEKARIRLHTVFGARLFRRTSSPYDKMAMEITLNHHERWDGLGYPGYITDLDSASFTPGPGKKERDIPLMARIVTVADIYDALSTKRSYKEAWKEDRIRDYLAENRGKIFDPELAEIFLDMKSVVQSIQNKYSDRREPRDGQSGDGLGKATILP